MTPRDEKDVELLYDYAQAKPEGFTYKDVARDLGWEDRSRLFRTARYVRLMFANDSINLVCEPQGQREPWRYRLVGTYAEARGWGGNRDRDLKTRVATICAVAKTLVHTTDGRTMEGKRARLVESTLSNLLVQLAAMQEAIGEDPEG